MLPSGLQKTDLHIVHHTHAKSFTSLLETRKANQGQSTGPEDKEGIMTSQAPRSNLSLVYSLNHSQGDLEGGGGGHTASVAILGEWNGAGSGSKVTMSTIPPLESEAWRKLPKFQRRYYEWLVYAHNLPVAQADEAMEYGNFSIFLPGIDFLYAKNCLRYNKQGFLVGDQ